MIKEPASVAADERTHHSTGHRFERQTAILLHHLMHLGPCLLRLQRDGRLKETPVQCGLFIAHGEEL